MSLKDAVLEIADEMVAESEKLKDFQDDPDRVEYGTSGRLRWYSAMLKIACKAGGDSSSSQPQSPEQQHALEIQKARKELHGGEEQPEDGICGAFCIGGPHDDVMWKISTKMPAGAKTMVGGNAVYVLNEYHQLKYSEEETKKLFSGKEK